VRVRRELPHVRGHGRDGERAEVDGVHRREAEEVVRWESGRRFADRAQHQDPGFGHLAAQVPQQVQRGRIGPLQVFQDEHETGRFGGDAQRRNGRLDGEEAGGGVGLGFGGGFEQGGFEQGGAELADAVAARLVQQAVPRPERRGALVRRGPADQHRAAAGGRLPCDRLDQGGLADARLTRHDRDGAGAGREQCAQRGELRVAANRGHGYDRPS
jgi:hypothetical protein